MATATEVVALEEKLGRVVRRIVEVARPRRIILFGSAARGETGPESDLDLMVVVPAGVHRRRTAQTIYCDLIGIGSAVDLVVVTEDDVEQFRNNRGMVIRPALEEGRLVYAA